MKTLAYILLTIFIVIITIAYCLFSAWIFSLAWLWLAVPIFNLPSINMYQSMAVVMLASYMTHQHIDLDEDKTKRLKRIYFWLARPFFLIFFAWILKGLI